MNYRPVIDSAQFKRGLAIVVVLPFSIGLFVALVSLWRLQDLRAAYRWLDHTDQVIAQAHQSERYMIDAESGIRGYWITGKNEFLRPYHEAMERFPAELAQLEHLVADNPEQHEKIQKLKGLTAEWQRRAKVFLLKNSKGVPIEQSTPNSEGRLLMENIRHTFDEFLAHEEELRVVRNQKVHASVKASVFIGFGLTILGGALAALAIHSIAMALRRNYQMALENREEQAEWFATTLTSIGDAVVVVDTRSKVQFLNPVAEKLSGWSLNEALGRSLSEVLHIVNEDDRTQIFSPVNEVLSLGRVIELSGNTLLLGREGREFSIEDSAAPMRDPEGKIYGVVLVFRDVGQKRKTERELKKITRELGEAVIDKEESLQILETLNSLGEKISAELDLDRLMQLVTEVATHLTKAQTGVFLYNLINEKGEAYTLSAWSGSLRSNSQTASPALAFEIANVVRSDDLATDIHQHVTPLSHLRIRSYLAVPVISRSGDILGGLFLGHQDAKVFTEKEVRLVRGLAAQAAVAIDNARLYQSVKDAVHTRDDFLSVASHELKTPLTSLKLQLQLTRRSFRPGGPPPTVEKLIHTLDLCLDQTLRLTNLVEDLLDVSRIRSGHLSYRFETEDMGRLVGNAIDRLRDQLRAAQCDVQLDLENEVLVSCDRFRMDQVVVNLLTNAMKYGAGKPIRIQVKKGDGRAKIMVEDNGIGIAKEKQSVIFGRFERAVTTRNYAGLGLGLYISQQIVAAHDGSIAVESEPGKGAMFTVTLPLENAKNLIEEASA